MHTHVKYSYIHTYIHTYIIYIHTLYHIIVAIPADAEINSSERNIPTSDARNAPMHTYAVSDASTHGANKLLYTYTSILP